VATYEFPDRWQNALQEINSRLTSNEEGLIISGLVALKNILKVYEFEINEDRKPLQ
jgi:hypothetical protein